MALGLLSPRRDGASPASRLRSPSAGLVVIALASLTCGCGDRATASDARAPSSPSAAPEAKAAEYSADDATWGKFHSKRFQLTVPLPDGKAWKIDDHRQAELVAVHPPTNARLQILVTQEDELMNHARCEEHARALGWVKVTPLAGRKRGRESGGGPGGEDALVTVEDHVQTGPDAYDSRIWVAIDPGAGNANAPAAGAAEVEGNVYLFGAFLRQCLLVRYVTKVGSAKDESVLASRLAVAGARIVRGITPDPLRTTETAVPRDKLPEKPGPR